MSMRARIHHAMTELPAAVWDQLNQRNYPFHRHAFLAALERDGGVTPDNGWAPHHLAFYDENDELVAGAPVYLKGHSWGEFVFDFAWADAFERHGHAYYPKLIAAVPFTPTTGPRVVHRDDLPEDEATHTLAEFARELVEDNQLSSMHWLFPDSRQLPILLNCGYLHRTGIQYHWYNADYDDFNDFLSELTSKKRKNIKRERRLVHEQGIDIETKHGDEVTASEWHYLHRFYEDTFRRRGNIPLLTERFFAQAGAALGWQVVLFIAREAGEMIAAALCFRDHETLYGRYWGSISQQDSLHFETCYYQGIEYCIRHGLNRFEPGAQGEHKIPRGFLPTVTHSCHWITDPQFRTAIEDFLARERAAVKDRAAQLQAHTPFRTQRP